MQPDPVMQAPFWTQGLNRYAYVFNDPLNATDPSGFIAEREVDGPSVTGGWLTMGMHGAVLSQVVSFNLGGGSAGAGIVALGNMLGIGKMTASTEVSRPNPTQAPRSTGNTPSAGGAPAQNKGQPGPALRGRGPAQARRPDDLRYKPPVRGAGYPTQVIPEDLRKKMQPFFDQYDIDLDDIRLTVLGGDGSGDLAGMFSLFGEKIILYQWIFSDAASYVETLAHEVGHLVQKRELGSWAMLDRGIADQVNLAGRDPYNLSGHPLRRVDRIDGFRLVHPRYALESTATRFGELVGDAIMGPSIRP